MKTGYFLERRIVGYDKKLSEESVEKAFLFGFKAALLTFAADEDSVFADNVNIFPLDTEAFALAQREKGFTPALNYKGHNSARAGINFNVTDVSEPACCF